MLMIAGDGSGRMRRRGGTRQQQKRASSQRQQHCLVKEIMKEGKQVLVPVCAFVCVYV
jgi:hypothetical protein